MNLTEFLQARIAELEVAARACDPRDWPVRLDDDGVSYQSDIPDAEQPYFAQGDLLNRFTPAYVLADCAAKRVAVDWYEHDDDIVMGPTIRAMAAIWADHPDYDESWRP